MRTNEDSEAGKAADPGGIGRQGRLTLTDGRAGKSLARPSTLRRYRLKRSLQTFTSRTGAFYLMRSGVGDDFLVADSSPSERAALELLGMRPHDARTLVEALEERGLPGHDTKLLLEELERLGLTEECLDSILEPELLERYDRQLIYFGDLAPPGIQAEVIQERLSQATIGILGCGGLGSWVACGLACAGVGRLVLIDDDRVELSNLNRQLLFREEDVGRLKVEAAAQALSRHNARLEVLPIVRRVRGACDLGFVPEVDLVIVTADWPAYELPRWVNKACMAALVPYITAGQFLPQLRVGPFVIPGEGACNDCLESHARKNYPLYEEISARRSERVPPAATMGAASGVVGSLLAMEAIHFLGRACPPATINASLVIDLTTFASSLEAVPPDPDCRACRQARAHDGS